jgi:hypothetical protein
MIVLRCEAMRLRYFLLVLLEFESESTCEAVIEVGQARSPVRMCTGDPQFAVADGMAGDCAGLAALLLRGASF